jgi:hypothetical protein
VDGGEGERGGKTGADGALRRATPEFLFESGADFAMVCVGAELHAGDFRARLLKIGRRFEMDGALDVMLLKAV